MQRLGAKLGWATTLLICKHDTGCHYAVRKHILNFFLFLLGAVLFQGSSSGWRWRPLSACCGECVKVTRFSAMQKWTRALLTSTLWAQSLKQDVLHYVVAFRSVVKSFSNSVISGRNKQKCCVSHLFLGRPDRTESSKNLRLVSWPLVSDFLLSVPYEFFFLLNVFSPISLSYHCHLYPHPENDEERADVLDSLRTRIQDLNNVGSSGGHSMSM